MVESDNDNDLISAYVDGQLSGPEKAAFEARLQADPRMRSAADATLNLVRASRQLPAPRLPRSFAIPATLAKPARPSTAIADWAVNSIWQRFFRLGSALAAAMFVLILGLDLRTGLIPPQTHTASAATLFPAGKTTLPAPAVSNASMATTATGAVVIQTPLNADSATRPTSVLPKVVAGGHARTSADTGADAAAPQAISTLPALAALTAAATPKPPATVLEIATPAPTSALEPVAEPAQPEGPVRLPYIAAGICLLLTLGLGYLGWVRR